MTAIDTPPTVWGIHNDLPIFDFVERGSIAIGWSGLGDIGQIRSDRSALKAALSDVYPHKGTRTFANWAGVLARFAGDIQIGDVVVHPHRPDSTVAIGVVIGDYEFSESVDGYRHRRAVEWKVTGLPRTTFSQPALYEIGALITIFRVRTHAEEFLSALYGAHHDAPSLAPSTSPPEGLEETAEEEPSAGRIEQATRDFVVRTLASELEGTDFEAFVGDLLRAMGYQARVTQASGDRGVDVIAHRDPLGVEPPIIKVQCKRTTSAIGPEAVRALAGVLAGQGERGLFVTLGGYSKDAEQFARSRQDLRLIKGDELVDLILVNYDRLRSEYRRLLPLRPVFVVDRPSRTHEPAADEVERLRPRV